MQALARRVTAIRLAVSFQIRAERAMQAMLGMRKLDIAEPPRR